MLGKTRVGSFADSMLLGYLCARDVKHVVLCGLMTEGAVLSSVDFISLCRARGSRTGDEEVQRFVMEKLLGGFCDVVGSV